MVLIFCTGQKPDKASPRTLLVPVIWDLFFLHKNAIMAGWIIKNATVQLPIVQVVKIMKINREYRHDGYTGAVVTIHTDGPSGGGSKGSVSSSSSSSSSSKRLQGQWFGSQRVGASHVRSRPCSQAASQQWSGLNQTGSLVQRWHRRKHWGYVEFTLLSLEDLYTGIIEVNLKSAILRIPYHETGAEFL